jgi:glutaredoxin 3
MPAIEIYTQDWCPFCTRAKQVFDRRGVAYTEIDAPRGSPARAEAAQRAGGRSTVPQIFIDGAYIGGCDELLAMERAGRLDPLLQAA